MYWTKKHQKWRLHFGLRPSSAELWQWINRRTKGNTTEEIEIDLREFNKWVAKQRGYPMDVKTIKEAIVQLFEDTQGLITLHKKITWYYFKIVVKPISFLEQKDSDNLGKLPNTESSKPAWHRSSEDEKFKQQQQSLSKLDTLLRGIGLRYDADALNKIWRFAGKSLDRVKQAVELMLYRHQTDEIAKPHGFLMSCLKFNWQDGFNLYYEPELPKFDSKGDLGQFLNSLCAS